jgi:outer membrane protein OmpA-like peptidoglycan-associated protein
MAEGRWIRGRFAGDYRGHKPSLQGDGRRHYDLVLTSGVVSAVEVLPDPVTPPPGGTFQQARLDHCGFHLTQNDPLYHCTLFDLRLYEAEESDWREEGQLVRGHVRGVVLGRIHDDSPLPPAAGRGCGLTGCVVPSVGCGGLVLGLGALSFFPLLGTCGSAVLGGVWLPTALLLGLLWLVGRASGGERAGCAVSPWAVVLPLLTFFSFGQLLRNGCSELNDTHDLVAEWLREVATRDGRELHRKDLDTLWKRLHEGLAPQASQQLLEELRSAYPDAAARLSPSEARARRGRLGLEKGEQRIFLASDTLFDFDSAVLRRPPSRELYAVQEALLANPTLFAVIEGHTDTLGDPERNLPLSRERAEAVRAFLTREAGINPNQLGVEALGATQPIVPSGDRVAQAANRRVELRLMPLGSAPAAAAKAPTRRRKARRSAAHEQEPAPGVAAPPEASAEPQGSPAATATVEIPDALQTTPANTAPAAPPATEAPAPPPPSPRRPGAAPPPDNPDAAMGLLRRVGARARPR